jgi:rhodanese-related sulfurtransferase
MTRAGTFRGTPVDHVVDVRTMIEFWLGHLDGAVNHPVDVVVDRLTGTAGVERNARILVYCASGARSAAAAAGLRQAGFTRVIDGGGMGAAARDFRAGA